MTGKSRYRLGVRLGARRLSQLARNIANLKAWQDPASHSSTVTKQSVRRPGSTLDWVVRAGAAARESYGHSEAQTQWQGCTETVTPGPGSVIVTARRDWHQPQCQARVPRARSRPGRGPGATTELRLSAGPAGGPSAA